MNKIDQDCLLLSRMQGRIFELSLFNEESSPVFIRRFMNSDAAERMDRGFFLNTSQSELQVIDEINEQYGPSSFGQEKYTKDELYWIGYTYRHWAYVYKVSSAQIYRIAPASEMRQVYPVYHSLDPADAAERIMEAKGYTPLLSDEDKNRKLEDLIRQIY